jgi:hypothetical protein
MGVELSGSNKTTPKKQAIIAQDSLFAGFKNKPEH